MITLKTIARDKKQLITAVLIILLVWVATSLIASLLVLLALQLKNISAAQVGAKIALPFVQTLSIATLKNNATIETWHGSFVLISRLDQLFLLGKPDQQNSFSVGVLKDFMVTNRQAITAVLQHAPRSPFVQKVLDPPLVQFLQTIEPQLPVIEEYLHQLSSGKHTWVLLFQNSEELRATGGFLGSYALVNINDGVVAEVVIEDVYDADGQFTGFITAPPGVNEYLSSNNGLRLPDANWFIDFPSSAKTIMQFFALSDKQAIDGVVAINLEVVEAVVELVGPLWLSDYNAQVTSENLSHILRDKRGDFFPGSQDKKQLLRQVWNQLKFALSGLDFEGRKRLASEILQQMKQKNIQFYSVQPRIQTVFEEMGVAGRVTTAPHYFLDEKRFCLDQKYSTCPTDYFYLIESNVGVNKANRALARAAIFTLGEYRSTISYTLTNHNTPPTAEELAARKGPGADHNAYVNYQRIILPADYQIISIATNNQAVDRYDQTELTIDSSQNFQQVGFLVAIREQETTTITIEVSHARKNQAKPRIVTIQKQPGVPPYSVTITSGQQREQLMLEKDSVVVLN